MFSSLISGLNWHLSIPYQNFAIVDIGISSFSVAVKPFSSLSTYRWIGTSSIPFFLSISGVAIPDALLIKKLLFLPFLSKSSMHDTPLFAAATAAYKSYFNPCTTVTSLFSVSIPFSRYFKFAPFPTLQEPLVSLKSVNNALIGDSSWMTDLLAPESKYIQISFSPCFLLSSKSCNFESSCFLIAGRFFKFQALKRKSHSGPPLAAAKVGCSPQVQESKSCSVHKLF